MMPDPDIVQKVATVATTTGTSILEILGYTLGGVLGVAVSWVGIIKAFKAIGGNGNGKKSAPRPASNSEVGKAVTDAVQDSRLNSIENSHKDLKEDMRDIREGQNKIIERQGEIGGKVDIILNFIVGSKSG